MQWIKHNILPQSSEDFDPEANPELKIHPDRYEITIRRNFRKHRLLIRTKIISRTYITKFLEMARSLQLLIRNEILMIRDDWDGIKHSDISPGLKTTNEMKCIPLLYDVVTIFPWTASSVSVFVAHKVSNQRIDEIYWCFKLKSRRGKYSMKMVENLEVLHAILAFCNQNDQINQNFDRWFYFLHSTIYLLSDPW